MKSIFYLQRMKCNLQKPACLSCLPLVLTPSDWEVQLFASALEDGSMPQPSPEQVQSIQHFPAPGLGWPLAELGHCTAAAAQQQLLKCWCFCASRARVRGTQATRQDVERTERLQGRVLGAQCCGQAIPHLTGKGGTCQEQVRSQGTIPVGHTDLGQKLPLHAAFPFQLSIRPLQLKSKAFIPSTISIIFNEEKKPNSNIIFKCTQHAPLFTGLN